VIPAELLKVELPPRVSAPLTVMPGAVTPSGPPTEEAASVSATVSVRFAAAPLPLLLSVTAPVSTFARVRLIVELVAGALKEEAPPTVNKPV